MNHVTLNGKQYNRHRDREHHHTQSNAHLLYLVVKTQAIYGMKNQKYRRAGNKRRLCQAGKWFGLAVAESMLPVGGGQRMSNRQQASLRGSWASDSGTAVEAAR